MCGIAGFMVGQSDERVENGTALLGSMSASLCHRGPDAQGSWINEDSTVGLSHARLAIIDLTASGAQPMQDSTSRYVVTFNGELYNFKELRGQLEKEGVVFRTPSDTEVLIAVYSKWGIPGFSRIRGMFACAIYDRHTHELVIARDALGKKPLYYTLQKGSFVFGSELKALRLHPSVSCELDSHALASYLVHDYVPTPLSIFNGIHKCMPGSAILFSKGTITEEVWWKPCAEDSSESAQNDAKKRVSISDALTRLDSLLTRAVSDRLVADVPVGIFLSGGLDSSVIAWYAAQQAPNLKTFSIGFSEKSFDESDAATLVAKSLGTEHHTAIFNPEDALGLIPTLPQVFDEPVADASILPTLLLSKFARSEVTVALGGDGADELLLGYPTFQAERAAALFGSIPGPFRALLGTAARAMPPSSDYFSINFKIRKFIEGFHEDPATRHMQWLGSFSEAEAVDLLLPEYRSAASGVTQEVIDRWKAECPNLSDYTDLSHLYLRTYLMDEVLVKLDRASMRYSLEARTPFLDPELVTFLLGLPTNYKLREGQDKWLLRHLMKDRLPAEIASRKKHGFGVPMAAWLRGPLRPLVTSLLGAENIRTMGYFDPVAVEKLLTEHLDGVRDHRKKLWNLLMFALWHAEWVKK
jgi:asparagine synthase (glutamine-hydrolysing)